jgi:hypothetical protein
MGCIDDVNIGDDGEDSTTEEEEDSGNEDNFESFDPAVKEMRVRKTRAEDGGGDEGGGNGALFCVLTFVSTEEGGGECQPAGTRVKQSTII